MIKRRLISGILTGILTFTFMLTPVYGASLTEQLEASHAKKEEAQYQMDMTQDTIAGIEEQIVGANEEIDRITLMIEGLDKDIAELEANIIAAQKELDLAEEKRVEQEAAMDERVRTMYMYGNNSMLEFLFTSKDFSDLVTKMDMSRYIIEADKETLNALEATRKTIAENKKIIEDDRIKTVTKKAEQESALAQQQGIKNQKDELLSKNQKILEEYNAVILAEEANAANIEAQVQKILAEQKAEQARQAAAKAAEEAAVKSAKEAAARSEKEAAAAAAAKSTASASVSTPTPEINEGADNTGEDAASDDNASSSEEAEKSDDGSYLWPIAGAGPEAEDDYFGTRLHPIWGDYRTHHGVDMASPEGTPILLMGAGTVILAGDNGGYGNCVIVDMGNGLQAMYAHMSSIAVSEGDTLSRGDVVGGVGSTGDSTGNHLHFGVMLDGTFVDPLGYF